MSERRSLLVTAAASLMGSLVMYRFAQLHLYKLQAGHQVATEDQFWDYFHSLSSTHEDVLMYNGLLLAGFVFLIASMSIALYAVTHGPKPQGKSEDSKEL